MSPTHRTRRGLLIVVVLFPLALVGCGHGSKVQQGNIEVFYKDGATKAEAERLAAYLDKHWGALPGRRSVQLTRSGEGYQFRMVVKKEYQNSNTLLKQLQFDGARISRDVFEGAAIELHACDEHLKTLQVFPPRPDLRYGVVEGNIEVFYSSAIEKEDARRLAKYLANAMVGAPTQLSFKLARRVAIIEVHMVIQKEARKNPIAIAELRDERKGLEVNVFTGAEVELHLCDESFNVLEVLKP
jgi:hypothetical protein